MTKVTRLAQCRACRSVAVIEVENMHDWGEELLWICASCEWEEFLDETEMVDDFENCSEGCQYLYGYCIC